MVSRPSSPRCPMTIEAKRFPGSSGWRNMCGRCMVVKGSHRVMAQALLSSRMRRESGQVGQQTMCVGPRSDVANDGPPQGIEPDSEALQPAGLKVTADGVPFRPLQLSGAHGVDAGQSKLGPHLRKLGPHLRFSE